MKDIQLRLDDAVFLPILTSDITQGWVTVDVQIDDTANGLKPYMTTMIAGSVGMLLKASGDNGDGLDSVAPLSGWWVYLKKVPEDSRKSESAGSGEKELLVKYKRIWSSMLDEYELRNIS